jgi:hypothetical protein
MVSSSSIIVGAEAKISRIQNSDTATPGGPHQWLLSTKNAAMTTTDFDLDRYLLDDDNPRPAAVADGAQKIQFDCTRAVVSNSKNSTHNAGVHIMIPIDNPRYTSNTKTPSVSPVKARRLNSMNGDYGSCSFVHHDSCSSDSSLPPNVLEIMSPSSSSASSSSSSSSASSSPSSSSVSSSHNVLDDLLDGSIVASESFQGEAGSSTYLSIIQTTIHEEAVEMTLHHQEVASPLAADDPEQVVASAYRYHHCRRIMLGEEDHDYDDDDEEDIEETNRISSSNHHHDDDHHHTTCAGLNSSIVWTGNDYDSYEHQTTSTPAKVEYCGIIWPCCHSATGVLVDDHLNAKICASLSMEHWTCWQISYQASPAIVQLVPTAATGVPRRYRRGHTYLDSLRRTLIPIEPKKTHSFSPTFIQRDQSFGNSSCDSGYESDPEIHLIVVNKTTTTTPSSSLSKSRHTTLRATTIDEFFNERLRLMVHTPTSSTVVTFWLERGMARFAIPPQICWHDGHRRTAIPILEITKILSGTSATTAANQSMLSIPASTLRCFRICVADGTTYTLETASVSMQQHITALLKTTVATLAAAVLTHGNVDEFFVRKEAWI